MTNLVAWGILQVAIHHSMSEKPGFPVSLPLSQSHGDAIHRGSKLPWEKDRKHLVEARSESEGWTSESCDFFFGLKMTLVYGSVYSEVPLLRKAGAAFLSVWSM